MVFLVLLLCQHIHRAELVLKQSKTPVAPPECIGPANVHLISSKPSQSTSRLRRSDVQSDLEDAVDSESEYKESGSSESEDEGSEDEGSEDGESGSEDGNDSNEHEEGEGDNGNGSEGKESKGKERSKNNKGDGVLPQVLCFILGWKIH